MHAVVQTTSRVQPRIVIVGSGISGLLVAQFLVGVEAEVVVLRQPMLSNRQRQFSGLLSSEDLKAVGLSETGKTCGLPIDTVTHVMRDADAEQREDVAVDWIALSPAAVLSAVEDALLASGISVAEGMLVDELAETDGRVTGVIANESGAVVQADVVILADESDPRLADQVGLRPDWLPTQLMHIGKVRFPATNTEIRSRLGTAEGRFRIVSLKLRSEWGAWGYALVIPGLDSITVLSAMLLEDEMVSSRHIREFLDEVEALPVIASLIDGLDSEGFCTEVVPIGGFDERLRFHTDGFLVASDMVGVTHPLNRDGLSLNLRVAAAAAMATRDALRRNDFSAGSLSSHSRRLVDEVTSPIHFRRRQHQWLKHRAAWEWASLPDLVPAWQEVTPSGISANLPKSNSGGMWQRVRRLGRQATNRPPGIPAGRS